MENNKNHIAQVGGMIRIASFLGIGAIPILFLCFVVGVAAIVSVFSMSWGHDEYNSNGSAGSGGTAKVSQEVMRYEPIIRQYAKEAGIEEYVPILLALTQQESSGILPDVMQSSESRGLPRNTITDPVVSIQAGVEHFKKVLTKAHGDINLTLQSYNFGGGFIDFANERHVGYSFELAVEFSTIKAKEKGWRRYGDVKYVQHVMQYVTGTGVIAKLPEKPNTFGYLYPISNHTITSAFGMRIHPITKVLKMHEGTDFRTKGEQLPIVAVKKGVVTRVGYENPNDHNQGFGLRIYLDLGNGIEAVYAHLSSVNVNVGDVVETGQVMGRTGQSGSASKGGPHLHFEIHRNGVPVDPITFLKGGT